jgi:quinol-cytochrome oxidoreductase complex cytochrome b subunit
VEVAVEPRRTAVQRTHRVLLALLGLLLVVLVGTGVWLSFRYQPSGHFAGARPESWVRVTHRTASTLFLFTALATFALSIAMSFERALKRGIPAWVVGLLLMVGALAASLSGHLLPWDQLALAPVARGEFRGFGFLFRSSNVHLALVASSEVTRDALRTSFLVHAVVIPVALVAIVFVGLRLTRRRRLLPP